MLVFAINEYFPKGSKTLSLYDEGFEEVSYPIKLCFI